MKIQKELYEKEIKELRKENTKLLARCEHAEKYMNEYQELNKQSKELINKYSNQLNTLKSMENEYKELLDDLKRQRGSFTLKH